MSRKEIAMNLQEKIYDCRKKAGLSQEALAEKIGVSRQAISKWETGEATPEISKLLLLAKTFGVTTDWLLSDNEPEEKGVWSGGHHDERDGSGDPTSNCQSGEWRTPPNGEECNGQSGEWRNENLGQGETAGTWQQGYEQQAQTSGTSWIDSLPGLIGRLFKRFGWLLGIYVTIVGGIITGVGALARSMVLKMANANSNMFGDNIDGIFGDGFFTGVSGDIFNNFENAANEMMNQAALNSPVYILGNVIMWFGIVVMVAGVVLAIVLRRIGRR